MATLNSIKISFPEHANIIRLSGLPLWKLGGILILSAALWMLCHNADAFSTSNAGDAKEMHTYTVVDGLVGPVVPVIFQDSRGFLWFGSESGGVSRFDGRTFKQFRLETDLSNGVTRQILEDRWGHIWFLTRLPTEHQGIVSYFNSTHIEKVGAATYMTLDNNGDIWTADNKGLTHYTSSFATEHRYNEETKRSSIKSTDYPFRSTADATVNVLFQGKDGTFWIGGSADASILLLSFDPDSDAKFIPISTIITNNSMDESIDPPQHLPVLASTDGTFAIHDIAQQGPYGVEHLWFAGRNLLLRFDGEKLHQILPGRQNMDQTDGQTRNPDDTVLHHDRFHNEIWFSDEGRIRWWDGNSLRKLYADNSNEFFGILKMQDALGSLWFVCLLYTSDAADE